VGICASLNKVWIDLGASVFSQMALKIIAHFGVAFHAQIGFCVATLSISFLNWGTLKCYHLEASLGRAYSGGEPSNATSDHYQIVLKLLCHHLSNRGVFVQAVICLDECKDPFLLE
jgi:hypothetical protein